MKVRQLRRTKPRPRYFTVGASVPVPEYIGPMGTPMNKVRLYVRAVASQMRNWPYLMRLLDAERDKYLAALPPATQEGTP
jgi:hypothetical protein